jgi:hypothetical protein
MLRISIRRVGRVLLVGALAVSTAAAATACGGSSAGEAGPAVKRTSKGPRTAQPSPPGQPRKQTLNVERGTTTFVGGLKLGVMRAHKDTGVVAVIAGPDVPAEGGEKWRVIGKAGSTKRLANGFTVSIDKVVNAKDDTSGTIGSGGGSVTVTVTPPD